MTWPIEQVPDIGELDDTAGVHGGHPVSELGSEREVVRDEHHREPELLAQRSENLDDGALGQDVERGGRLS